MGLMLQVFFSAGLGRDGPPTCLQGLQPGRMGLGEALQQRTWASPWVLSHPGRGGQSREKPSLEALDLSSSLLLPMPDAGFEPATSCL